MLEHVIRWSVRHRLVVVAAWALVAVSGAFALASLSFDAFPDVTPAQVQVNAQAPALGPLEIERQLCELGMEKAKFTVSFTPSAGTIDGIDLPCSPSGLDVIEFIVQTNPGLAPQPLRKIASGGELSRIMLALKSILASSDRVSVLVFDEIDAGIGGVVATAVARKLGEVARRHQVFVVTHLPQIACFADRHVGVRKHDGLASIEVLDDDARVLELSRMLAGLESSEHAVSHAEELLAEASRIRAGVR